MLRQGFEELVADIDGIVWEAEAQTFRFTFVSRQAERLLGYPLEQWFAPGFWAAHLHPEDRDWALELCTRASAERRKHDFEYRMFAADGRVVWLRDIVSVIAPAGEPSRLRGVMVDITKRKEAEHERQIHLHFLESMDRVNRAMQSTIDLESMAGDVLEAVLEIFGCDRAWLLYPCDPDTDSWRAPVQRTRPGISSLTSWGNGAGVREFTRELRSTEGPVRFDPESARPVPAAVTDRFGTQSSLAMAVYPRGDLPYAFGLHQCSHGRVWTKEEQRIFQEIGRRLGDALTSVLMLRSLKESEQRRAEAERLAQVGYWHRDFVSGRIALSDQACRLLGVSLEKRSDDLAECERQWQEAIHANDRERVLAAAAAALAGGPRYDVEYRLVRLDGEERTIHSLGDVTWDEQGRPLRMFGFMQDISERKRAEQALRDSHSLLNAVVEGTPDAIFVKDRRGRYLMINSAGARLLGKAVEEVIGQDDTALFDAESAHAITERDRDVMASEVLQTFEEIAVTAGGTRTCLTTTKGPYRDGAGEVIGVIGFSRDVTEVKRLEQQFRQAQKMEAVGRLAGGMAHDFNNLLTVINGYSEVALSQLGNDEPSGMLLVEIREAGERAANLTRQLLAFSRQQVLQPHVVNLNNLLGDVCRLLRPLLGEAIQTSLVAEPLLASVKVDAGQFEHAIINLAINARDAMPRGGRLIMETLNVELDENYIGIHPDVRAGSYVCVALSDTGHGMDAPTKARIFEPFFTTKPPGKGTGLGLAMVYGFVKQSGGHVTVYSESGQGTTFKIYLPEVEEPTANVKPPNDVLDDCRGTETVLLVEDEDAVRRLAKVILESMGYQVFAARDGEEALALFERLERPIDILISDLVMPRLGGRELAAHLKRSRPNLPALLMSGYTEELAMPGVASDRSLAFLQKPFSPTVLVRKVRELLDAHREP